MADFSSDYEKLGQFYLGVDYDVQRRELSSDLPSGLTLYDSRDLVTHAVCVGMTGSGKTGLGVALIEEAAIDGIPALVVDPKGDLTNLLLNSPSLKSSDFKRWINVDDARRADMTREEYAAQQAAMWEKGITDWHQNKDRIGKLGASCDFNIFTPGSDAGIPISILSTFAVPPRSVMQDADLLRDRISTTATSLLTLLGIDADPIRSRDHILLTTVLDHCWRNGQSLDIGSLIQMVQSPPTQKIGVMDLESFYPAKDRFELAMLLNNLLAAPGFSAWMSGEPLDVDRLLYTPTGKPRVSIFYIAHLSDAERMFFMSLLLNETLGWMRGQRGTTSLRALLYIDELFGYMPPVANPPSKKPLLTLLKQARAYGLGLVLSTQNPVDLDYKGLSNTGTWFLGRLQTERDKKRVLDGMEGASAEAGESFDRDEIDGMLSRLDKRVFLMHNVHEEGTTAFQTRWTLSYLAGPMTRMQIKRLMLDRKKTLDEAVPPVAMMAHDTPSAADASHVVGDPIDSERPVLPPGVSQVFLPIRRASGSGKIIYEPRLLAVGRVHFVDTRRNLAADEEIALLASLDRGAFGIDWDSAESIEISPDDLQKESPRPGSFADVPTEASQPKNYTAWRKELEEYVYRQRRHRLFRCKQLGAYSESGETERDFRIRLTQRAREQRDEQIEKLREKYASRLASAQERVRKAQLRVEREQEQAEGAKMQSMISTGAAVLAMVLGRRRLSSRSIDRAATAARGHGRAQTQADDVRRALEDVDAYEEKLEDLGRRLQDEIEKITDKLDVEALELDELLLKPRKSDIDIRHVALAWAPFSTDVTGRQVPLF